jgi:hypothetical protein
MMRLSHLKTHWTPEEAHTVLTFLDDVRDTLWQAYGNSIVEHYRLQQAAQQEEDDSDFEDDTLSF